MNGTDLRRQKMNKYHNVESLDFDENTLTIVLQGTHQRVSKHIRDPFIAE